VDIDFERYLVLVPAAIVGALIGHSLRTWARGTYPPLSLSRKRRPGAYFRR